MGTYTYAQLEAFWDNAGGNPSLASTMAAVGEAESGGRDVQQQGQPYGSTGWGIWQITPGNSVPSIGVDNALLNPANNAKAAVKKEQEQGLGAWTTYTDGAYQKFMKSGVTPDGSGITQASLSSSMSSTIQSTILSGIMNALGIPSVKDLAERAGLIVLGALLVIVAVFRFTDVGKTVGHTAVEATKVAAVA